MVQARYRAYRHLVDPSVVVALAHDLAAVRAFPLDGVEAAEYPRDRRAAGKTGGKSTQLVCTTVAVFGAFRVGRHEVLVVLRVPGEAQRDAPGAEQKGRTADQPCRASSPRDRMAHPGHHRGERDAAEWHRGAAFAGGAQPVE